MKRTPVLLLLWLAAGCESATTAPPLEEDVGAVLGITAGLAHSCALTASGAVLCWGRNDDGQLGDGTRRAAAEPVRVQAGTAFVEVSGGAAHSCALAWDASIHCWGANDRGQLGTGGREARLTPTPVASAERFASVSAGAHHSCALTADRRVFCWGRGDHGGTGTESGADVLTPREIDTPIRFTAISAGGRHSCGLDTGARAHCWGSNDRGQLGDASLQDRPLPGRAVHGDFTWLQISAGFDHTCAVRSDARAFCWGSNVYGELGEGAPPFPGAGSVTPYAVRGEFTVSNVTAGHYASCLVDTARRAWCWGRGSEGQLGNGGRLDYLVPHPVRPADGTTGVPFLELWMGERHVCGLATGEAIFCWGSGDDGQLGAGSFRFSELPVRVRYSRVQVDEG